MVKPTRFALPRCVALRRSFHWPLPGPSTATPPVFDGSLVKQKHGMCVCSMNVIIYKYIHIYIYIYIYIHIYIYYVYIIYILYMYICIYILLYIHIWLVVSICFKQPLCEFVNWDDEYHIQLRWKSKIHVPVTTNMDSFPGKMVDFCDVNSTSAGERTVGVDGQLIWTGPGEI